MMRIPCLPVLAGCACIFTASAVLAQSNPAQLLFSNHAVTVTGADGKQRTVIRGETLRAGDRLNTPAGGIIQIKLPDGTLLSARPETEVKLERIAGASDKNVLLLNQGSVRVINVDQQAASKSRPVEIVTPLSTMRFNHADGEAIHIKPDSRTQGGTYNRVQAGEAKVSTPRGETNLQPRGVGFVPRPDAPPQQMTALPPEVARLVPAASGAPGMRPPASPGAPGGPGPSQMTSLIAERAFVDQPPGGQRRPAEPGQPGRLTPGPRPPGAQPFRDSNINPTLRQGPGAQIRPPPPPPPPPKPPPPPPPPPPPN